jgi:putative cell wall-binding protein
MKLEVQNCATDDLKETMMSIFYDYCNFDNDTLMSLKDYASSLNEDDINNAKKVNINQEFNLVNKVLSADNSDETIGSNAYETEKLFFEQKLLHKMDFDIRSKAIDLALINWHNISPDEHITTHR